MAVGDWFYQPDFYYDAGMVVKALLEYVSRDGNLTLCVSLTPDGGMDKGSTQMLKEIGAWMKLNGEGIYGSHAWKEYGEGERVPDPKNPDKPARLRNLPGGKLGKRHAEFQFSTKDFRFTEGKDGSIYAYGMTVPQAGEVITIQSFKAKGLLEKPIRSVQLLGFRQKLNWKQTDEGLLITYPKGVTLAHVVGFKIQY